MGLWFPVDCWIRNCCRPVCCIKFAYTTRI